MYKTEQELKNLQLEYDKDILQPTVKEKLVVNPKVAYEVTNDDIKRSIPDAITLKRLEPVYGKLSDFSTKYTPVDNLLWDYLYFTDSKVFSPAGNAFMKSYKQTKGKKGLKPTYTKHLPGTTAYKKFWEEEFIRITKGYEPIIDGKPCGLRISGEFYFYLNYGWMEKVIFNEQGEVVSDESGTPDFLTMDYYFYKELEARENPAKYSLAPDYKQSMSVTKSRRKGFSYKAGSGAVWCTAFRNKAKVLIASAQGRDATLCFQKAMDVVDHITRYTPFGRKDPGHPSSNGGWKHMTMSQTKDHGEFVFGLFNTRSKLKRGRRSEIVTASLFNKPDAASGEGLTRLYIEEAGKISNLADAWVFSLESMRVGSVYRSGIAIIFGTGGSMVSDTGKKGSSQDFANMNDRPDSVGLASFKNIYEYKPTQRNCGFFVSDMWANFGSKVIIDGEPYYGLDDNGNAIFWIAELALNKERIGKRPPLGKKKAYDKFLTQRCKTPSEAFLITTGSRFQTEDLVERKTKIATSRGGFEALRMPGELVEISGRIEFIPKPNEEPLLNTYNEAEREGCFLRYEPPLRLNGSIPEDAYIISVDPVGINTDSGQSLSAIIVFKTRKYEAWLGPEKIVGIYFGRKKLNPQGYVHRLLLKLSKYYNAKITIENDRDGGIPQYFIRKGEAGRLMGPPITTMEKIMPNSKTSRRPYGHSMSTLRHKQIGEDLLYEWLDLRGSNITYYDDEDGEKTIETGLRNIDRLEDELLIDQLINYERGGNYDLVMAMMGIVMQLKEWYDPEDSDPYEENSISDQLNKWKINKYGSYEDKLEYNKRTIKL
jgi:hypothetical protein